MESSFRLQSPECWGMSVLDRPVMCAVRFPSLLTSYLPQQYRDELPCAGAKAATGINSLRELPEVGVFCSVFDPSFPSVYRA